MWPFSLVRGRLSVAALTPDEAALFEREFKEVGIGWALIAGFAAIMIYLVIIIVSAVREESVRGIFEIRAAIVVMLVSMIVFVIKLKKNNIDWAQRLVTIASASTLYATAFIALLANVDDPKTVLAVPSALIFGLFLHYCFLNT